MGTISIPISDALEAYLLATRGSLAEIRAETRQRWRNEAIDAGHLAKLKEESEAGAVTAIQRANQHRQVLEAQY